MSIPTAHIEAKSKNEIARTVLMPGDPLRAKYIAEHFLEEVQQYNQVRGMLGFTGKYKGVPVSVQGSGMGMPSMGIYSYELFSFYDVENIIRIGTAAAMDSTLKIKDIVFAMGASSNSNFAAQYGLTGTVSALADYDLLECAVNQAKKSGVHYNVGPVLSSDYFYVDQPSVTKDWSKLGIMAVEMESAALYMNAARLRKRALCMLTISDIVETGEETSSKEREQAFTDMMEIALETVYALEKQDEK